VSKKEESNSCLRRGLYSRTDRWKAALQLEKEEMLAVAEQLAEEEHLSARGAKRRR
jgi:DNA-binding PadR family transcriptional regulator